jgi:hypothetical protein
MLSRIVAPEIQEQSANLDAKEYEAKLHDTTYGITSDPLTQFAVVFSALIHDVGMFACASSFSLPMKDLHDKISPLHFCILPWMAQITLVCRMQLW